MNIRVPDFMNNNTTAKTIILKLFIEARSLHEIVLSMADNQFSSIIVTGFLFGE